MNDYDRWKQQTPPEFERDNNNRCLYCGDPINDDQDFCSRNCKKGYENDN